MKEHSLFLMAGFPAKETEFIKRADRFREEFEEGLKQTVKLADGIVSRSVLNSGEIRRSPVTTVLSGKRKIPAVM